MRRILLFLLFCPLLSWAQLDTTMLLTTETGTLSGSLLLPSNSGTPLPVALIIAGSGPTDRNGNNMIMANNSLKMLAEGLAAQGIASLRYDKRGIGESKKAGMLEADLRFEHYVADARAWAAQLAADSRFSKVVIIGHSEGALIGAIAAQEAKVAQFVSIAGTGRKAADILREQLAAQPQGVLDLCLPILDQLEQGDTVSNVSPMLLSLFRPSVQPYLISWFRYDPTEALGKLGKKPILIVQGTTDIQVTEADAHLLAKAAPHAELLILEGMNHVLKPAPADRSQAHIATYSNPTLPLAEGLVTPIAQFILQ